MFLCDPISHKQFGLSWEYVLELQNMPMPFGNDEQGHLCMSCAGIDGKEIKGSLLIGQLGETLNLLVHSP
jgi:hypothetical protein